MSFGKFKDDKNSDQAPVSSSTKAPSVSSSSDASLGIGSKISGTLNFDGSAEISGEVEGEVYAKGRLTISETAKVKARIQGTEILVKGTVEGDIVAAKRLVLMRPAKVFGNISSASLSIEEGVLFEGGCEMLQSESNNSSALKQGSGPAEDNKKPPVVSA